MRVIITDPGRNRTQLHRPQIPPLSGRHPVNPQLPQCDADQTQCRQAYRCRHPPHLPVSAFCQRQFDPCRRDQLSETDRRIPRWQLRLALQDPCGRRQCPAVLDHHTLPQLSNLILDRRPLNLGPIGTGMGESRIGQPVLQISVGGQQQQPFTVQIQPPGRVDIRHRNVVLQRRPARARLVRELRQHPVGLVEKQSAVHDACQTG